MNDYSKGRNENVEDLLAEKRNLERFELKNHNRLNLVYTKLEECLESIKNGEDKKRRIINKIINHRSKLSSLTNFEMGKRMLQVEVSKEEIESNPERIKIVSRKVKKRFKSNAKIEETKLLMDSSKINTFLKEARRDISYLEISKSEGKRAGNLLDRLDETSQKIDVKDISKLPDFYEFVKSKEMKQTLDDLLDFCSQARLYSPRISREEIKRTAKKNHRLLIDEERKQEEEKARYFNSTEGMIVSYVTYRQALRRLSSSDQTFYRDFLEAKTRKKLSLIEDEKISDVEKSLKKLKKEGRISEDHVSMIRKYFARVNLSQKEIKEDEEDLGLRQSILTENYNIPPETSIELASFVSNEDILSIDSMLSSTLRNDNFKEAIIKENPAIFLLDNGEVNKFTAMFYEVKQKAESFSDIEEFNPERNIKGFASFESLHETLSKIEDLESKLKSKECKSAKVWISNKALSRVEKDGYVGGHKLWYAVTVNKIAENPDSTKRRERIGEFTLFPTFYTGKKAPRVAFHSKDEELFIDDFLYSTKPH